LIKLLCLSLALSVLNTTAAQQLQGIIKDKNETTIAYVNIGIPTRNLGITTNENGEFSFIKTNEHATDTVYISAIGYSLMTLSFDKFKKQCETNTPFYLTKIVYELASVIVRPNTYETKTIGNTNVAGLDCERIDELFKKMDTASVRRLNSYKTKKGLSQKAFGFELGNQIKIKKGHQTFIDNIQFKTCLNANDTAIYRINVYGNETTLKKKITVIGQIKQVQLTNLLKQQIIIKTYGKTEVHNVSISNQNIEVDDDFIIGLECIYASNSKMNVGTKINVFGSTDFVFRPSAYASWIDVPLIDLTFVGVSVTTKKQKPFYQFW
jgi:CarboxypepD_reg-like domain